MGICRLWVMSSSLALELDEKTALELGEKTALEHDEELEYKRAYAEQVCVPGNAHRKLAAPDRHEKQHAELVVLDLPAVLPHI